jgi:hypothetical protein
MKSKNKTIWRLWAKSLGEKASKCDKESDKIAIIRTVIFFTYLITNIFIVYGVTRTHIFPSSKTQTQCYNVK